MSRYKLDPLKKGSFHLFLPAKFPGCNLKSIGNEHMEISTVHDRLQTDALHAYKEEISMTRYIYNSKIDNTSEKESCFPLCEGIFTQNLILGHIILGII